MQTKLATYPYEVTPYVYNGVTHWDVYNVRTGRAERTEKEYERAAFYARHFHMLETFREKTTEWVQVSGDHCASDFGATFARWERGEYVIVQVTPMSDYGDVGYLVTEFAFDYQVFDDADRVAQACAACGYGSDFQWSPESVFMALFDYGMQDERQPAWYGDDYGSTFPSLTSVMDSYGIPASALWSPDEYSVTPDETDETDE